MTTWRARQPIWSQPPPAASGPAPPPVLARQEPPAPERGRAISGAVPAPAVPLGLPGAGVLASAQPPPPFAGRAWAAIPPAPPPPSNPGAPPAAMPRGDGPPVGLGGVTSWAAPPFVAPPHSTTCPYRPGRPDTGSEYRLGPAQPSVYPARPDPCVA